MFGSNRAKLNKIDELERRNVELARQVRILNQENKEYRKNTELRFKEYWLRFRNLFFSAPQEIKTQVVVGIKNRMYAEGLLLESITFEQWIKEIENID